MITFEESRRQALGAKRSVTKIGRMLGRNLILWVDPICVEKKEKHVFGDEKVSLGNLR